MSQQIRRKRIENIGRSKIQKETPSLHIRNKSINKFRLKTNYRREDFPFVLHMLCKTNNIRKVITTISIHQIITWHIYKKMQERYNLSKSDLIDVNIQQSRLYTNNIFFLHNFHAIHKTRNGNLAPISHLPKNNRRRKHIENHT